MERVADAATPQPVLAAVRSPLVELSGLDLSRLVVVLEDVTDPGNAGSIVRSLEAAGAGGAVFTGHSVDPLNPKSLRASAGAIFQLPVSSGATTSVLEFLRGRGVTLYASVVRGGVDHRRVDWTAPSALVVGNESAGLSPSTIAACDERVSISMAGRTESLNVGVAAALVGFESLWRRGADGGPPSPSL